MIEHGMHDLRRRRPQAVWCAGVASIRVESIHVRLHRLFAVHAANSRNTSDWNLLMGTAKFFDALGEPTPIHAAMRAQCLGGRQGIGRSRIVNRTHVPKRTPAIRDEGAPVEAREIFQIAAFMVGNSRIPHSAKPPSG
jgi:hypothetical protein